MRMENPPTWYFLSYFSYFSRLGFCIKKCVCQVLAHLSPSFAVPRPMRLCIAHLEASFYVINPSTRIIFPSTRSFPRRISFRLFRLFPGFYDFPFAWLPRKIKLSISASCFVFVKSSVPIFAFFQPFMLLMSLLMLLRTFHCICFHLSHLRFFH